MKTNTFTGIPNHFRKRPLALLVGVLVSQGGLAGGAPPTPYVSLSSPSAVPTSGEPAICTGDVPGTVAVSVAAAIYYSPDSTGTYGAWSDCEKCDEGAFAGNVDMCDTSSERYRYRQKTDHDYTPGAVYVYANATQLSAPSPSTGSLTASTTEGRSKVTFTATITEQKDANLYTEFEVYATNGACGAATAPTHTYTDGPDTTTTNPTGTEETAQEAYYLVDLIGPTVEHDIGTAPVTVAQNGTLSFQITAMGGSAGTKYSLKALASGPADLEGSGGPYTFGTPSPNTGIAPDAKEAVGLPIGCSPVGEYTSDAELVAVDLCGNDWGEILSSTEPLPTFEVTADSGCSAGAVDTVVSAPLDSDNYELVECLTSHLAGPKNRRKTVSDPGVVHVGSVINLTDDEGCTSGVSVILEKDPDFDWEVTGKSPDAHVFSGTIASGEYLSYHYGTPLSEITGMDGVTIQQKTDTVTIGVPPGLLGCNGSPRGPWTLYARANVRLSADHWPGTDEEHYFSSSAAVDGGAPVEDAEGDSVVVENPTDPVCVNGRFDED